MSWSSLRLSRHCSGPWNFGPGNSLVDLGDRTGGVTARALVTGVGALPEVEVAAREHVDRVVRVRIEFGRVAPAGRARRRRRWRRSPSAPSSGTKIDGCSSRPASGTPGLGLPGCRGRPPVPFVPFRPVPSSAPRLRRPCVVSLGLPPLPPPAPPQSRSRATPRSRTSPLPRPRRRRPAGREDVLVRRLSVRVQHAPVLVDPHAEARVRLVAKRVVDEPLVAVRRLLDVEPNTGSRTPSRFESSPFPTSPPVASTKASAP